MDEDVATTAPEAAPELVRLAEAFAELGQGLAQPTGSVLEALTAVAVRQVEGADFASVTNATSAGFRTLAGTDDLATVADRLQYDVGAGPCVDAAEDDAVYHPRDLAEDPRWPEFGPRAAELGIRSMLSYRLALDPALGRGALNLYSRTVDAFSDEALLVGLLLATHGALAVNAARHENQVSHLQRALESNRLIGTAMGIVMAKHHTTRQQAFDLLSIVSQHTNRKLADVAAEVVELGVLEPPRGPWQRSDR